MKRIVLYILICLMVAPNALAQKQFRTPELERLAIVLSLDVQILKEGYNHSTAQGLQLNVHVKDKTIDHIGLLLFSDELRILGNSPVFDFLERYFLQLKYPPMVKTVSNMLRDDEFKFITGSISSVDYIRITDDFSFSNDRNKYVATWTRDGKPLLSVSFPVEYELISGENKIEAEENLLSDIKNTQMLKSIDDTTRNEYYIDKCFSNRLYLLQGQLVSDIKHPIESVANMMLSTNTIGKYQLNVTQISYGFQKKNFQVPLQQWISFCQTNGCQLYFGVDEAGMNGEVCAVVLAVNQAENYNHVLMISVPSDTIRNRQGTIDARLYPYVPTHNVMNMFGNYRKSNPKTFVSR